MFSEISRLPIFTYATGSLSVIKWGRGDYMFVSPVLLHRASDNLPFDDDTWISELKMDGIRLILSRFNGITRLYTRHKNEVTSKFKELLDLPLPDNIVLDGELIVTDEKGRPCFESMMERFQSTKSMYKVVFTVFDILYYEGEKVTHFPLVERKVLLEKVIPEDLPLITKVQWMYGNGVAYFELIKQHGLEGIVQKRADSIYSVNKRSQDWLKVINYQYAETIITGLRKDEFGLLLGVEEDDKVKPAGIMEFMQPEAKKQFYKQYRELVVGENEKFIFLEPRIKCKVKFRNFTKAGKLRIPSFVEYV